MPVLRALSRSGHLACAVATVIASGACAHADDYVVVTVDARAAVRDAHAISVTLSNAGASRSDNLTLRSPSFPVTFSISAPGRTGELDIAIDASDDGGAIIGHGSATAKVTDAAAHVLLDATDFVVNTDVAGDQLPSNDFEAAGFQLAALPDGTWTVAFRDACPQSACSIFARRFDHTGKPATTHAAAGTNAFGVSARTTDSRSTPAIASSRTSTAAIWDFYDATTSGIACRAIDATGALNADQVADATDAADVASITATADDNFIATWKTVLPASGFDAIRTVLIKPDCTALGAVQTVAQGAALADVVHRGSVATSTDHALFAWITNGDLHTRMMSSAGVFTTADTALVLQTATERIEHARVAAATGGGFVIAARWVQKAASTGPGRIDLFRVSPAGALVGTPVLVSDRSGTAFNSSESFAMASRADGTVLIAWHSCTDPLDDSTCDVFGRIARDTGDLVTDLFTIPTTTAGAQLLPSVVGIPDGFVAVWADGSHLPPDTSMQAVRARIIYPP